MPVYKCKNNKWRIGDGECKYHTKQSAENAFKHWIETKENYNINPINPKDIVSMDVPLMIRIFEYIREEVKTDKEIHIIASNLVDISSSEAELTMDDYDRIIPEKDKSLDRIQELSGIKKY